MNKIIGVIGGMGPEATISFYQKITKLTPAKKDQDHLHLLIDSYPQIPDRTGHIVRGTESPLPKMIEAAQRLENAGADYLVMTCMTAHYFAEQVQAEVKIELISAFKVLQQYLLSLDFKPQKIGILATSGSRAAKVFDKHLKALDLLYPTAEEQEKLVMEAIYGEKGIKAGYLEEASNLLEKAAKELIKRKAEVIIGGCTEIPLALKQEQISVPFIDPMEILAKKLIQKVSS